MLNFTAKKDKGNPQAVSTSSSDKQVPPVVANDDKSHPASKTKSTSPKKKHPSKPISAAKLAANRENSKRSTGPRTQEGKERVRWNAMKLGILAKTLAAVDAKADPVCKELMTRLAEELRPQTVAEEMMIDLVVVNYLRLGRGMHHEAMLDLAEQWAYPHFGLVSRHTATVERQLTKSLSALEKLRRERGNNDIPEIGNDVPFGFFENEETVSPVADCSNEQEDGVTTSAFTKELSKAEASNYWQPISPQSANDSIQKRKKKKKSGEFQAAAATELAASQQDNESETHCVAFPNAQKSSQNKPTATGTSHGNKNVPGAESAKGCGSTGDPHSLQQNKATVTASPNVVAKDIGSAKQSSGQELDPLTQYYADRAESKGVNEEERARAAFVRDVRLRMIEREGSILD
jgi:hypothetical protein